MIKKKTEISQIKQNFDEIKKERNNIINRSVYINSSNIKNTIKNNKINENKQKESEIDAIRKSLIAVKTNQEKKIIEKIEEEKIKLKKEEKKEEKKEIKKEVKKEDKKGDQKEGKKEEKNYEKKEKKDETKEKKEIKNEKSIKNDIKNDEIKKDEKNNKVKEVEKEIKNHENKEIQSSKTNFKESINKFLNVEKKGNIAELNQNLKDSQIIQNNKKIENKLNIKENKEENKNGKIFKNITFKDKIAIFNNFIEKNNKKEKENQDYFSEPKTSVIKDTIKNIAKTKFEENNIKDIEYKQTFNTLHNLQTILKKESSFKELCKNKIII